MHNWWLPFVCIVWVLFVWSMGGQESRSSTVVVTDHAPTCALNPCTSFR